MVHQLSDPTIAITLLGEDMRQLWMKGSLVAVLLVVSPGLLAAGFVCKQSNGIAEKKICGDDVLSRLDDQLAQSFMQARSRAGKHEEDLVRDQRNWLAERNDFLIFRSDPQDVYRERIEFLDHLFRDAKQSSPLLQAIYDHITNPRSTVNDANQPWGVLGGDGSVFRMAEEQNLKDVKSAPFDLDAFKALVEPMEADMLAFLRAEQVGGVSAEGGTGHWVSWSLFDWSGRATHTIATPIVLDNCGECSSGLAEYQGKAYALHVAPGITTGDLEVQAHLGGDQWGEASRLLIRYDGLLLPSISQCAERGCQELSKIADKIVARYDKSYDATTWVENMSASDSAKFELLETLTQQQRSQLGSLPDFDGHPKYQNYFFREFGESASWFPVLWHGELLIGRIGNGRGGAHDSPDWVLAIWRWDGHVFTPLLGMVTGKESGRILLAAFLPSKYRVTIVSH
jgi:uncharacterized protein